MTIPVDGVLGASQDIPDFIMPDELASHGLGSFHGMPSTATFDELAIYDRALSPLQLDVHRAAATR